MQEIVTQLQVALKIREMLLLHRNRSRQDLGLVDFGVHLYRWSHGFFVCLDCHV